MAMKPSEVLELGLSSGFYEPDVFKTSSFHQSQFMCNVVSNLRCLGDIDSQEESATLAVIERALHGHHSLRLKLGKELNCEPQHVPTEKKMEFWNTLIAELKAQDK